MSIDIQTYLASMRFMQADAENCQSLSTEKLSDYSITRSMPRQRLNDVVIRS
jgi:hypothetical protein